MVPEKDSLLYRNLLQPVDDQVHDVPEVPSREKWMIRREENDDLRFAHWQPSGVDVAGLEPGKE